MPKAHHRASRMRLSHPWAAIALNRAMAPPILVKTLLVARVSLDPPHCLLQKPQRDIRAVPCSAHNEGGTAVEVLRCILATRTGQ